MVFSDIGGKLGSICRAILLPNEFDEFSHQFFTWYVYLIHLVVLIILKAINSIRNLNHLLELVLFKIILRITLDNLNFVSFFIRRLLPW
jgi:hypothetical protein